MKILLLALLLNFGFCSSSFSEERENFDDFLKQYSQNEEFFNKRTIFPINWVNIEAGLDYDGKPIKPEIVPLSKEKFELMQLSIPLKINKYKLSVIRVTEQKECGYAACKIVLIGLPNSDLSFYYHFALINNLWVLKEIKEYGL